MLVSICLILFNETYCAALKYLGIYLPLITADCAVLGVTVKAINDGYKFIEFLANSFSYVKIYARESNENEKSDTFGL